MLSLLIFFFFVCFSFACITLVEQLFLSYVNNCFTDIIIFMQILEAKSCADLHRAVGEDFWLSTWCNSTAFEG